MNIAKQEECPRCGASKRPEWNYDAQICSCGYGEASAPPAASRVEARSRMMDLTTLRDRVRAAEGAGRALDAEIWFAFADHSETDADVLKQAKRHKGEIGKLFSAWFPGWRDNEAFVPRYTASIDAALRLVEAKLPGWSWEVRKSGFGNPAQAYFWNPMKQPRPGDGHRAEHNGGSTPLAIILCLLTALSEGANSEARRANMPVGWLSAMPSTDTEGSGDEREGETNGAAISRSTPVARRP